MRAPANRPLIDNGKADPNDYNMYGWITLFDGKQLAEGVKQAQQATMLTHDSSYAYLHTLACLYAYEGKTAEARDLLAKAMAAANEAVPDFFHLVWARQHLRAVRGDGCGD